MPRLIPVLQSTEPDPATLEKLATAERVTLAAVVLLVALNLGAWLAAAAGMSHLLQGRLMNAESAVTALLCGLSLWLSAPSRPDRVAQLGKVLAAAAAIVSLAVLCEYIFHVSFGVDLPLGAGQELPVRMSLPAAGGFAFLAVVLLILQTRRQPAVLMADLLVFFLVMLVLVLVSGHFLALTRYFGPAAAAGTSSAGMIALLLLTAVAFLRKAENGLYSILLGRGFASNIARGLSPLILILPFLREAARAHFLGSKRMPAHYTTAVLASLAVMLSFALLLFLAWRINRMEMEIHDLSLRDDLTDLYNLRGFRLLAEQALRMARRSDLSFSVLFIDLDDLKRTNDTLGHQAGSDFLVETGRILKSSFREADVVGRIGGDEFAVAGQFNQSGITLAAQRIEESVARRNGVDPKGPPLSLSIGYITSDPGRPEALSELLAQADKAMYAVKRRNKARAEIRELAGDKALVN